MRREQLLDAGIQAGEAVAQRRRQPGRRPAQVGGDRFDELALLFARREVVALGFGDQLDRRAFRRHQPLALAEVLPRAAHQARDLGVGREHLRQGLLGGGVRLLELVHHLGLLGERAREVGQAALEHRAAERLRGGGEIPLDAGERRAGVGDGDCGWEKSVRVRRMSTSQRASISFSSRSSASASFWRLKSAPWVL